MRDYTFIVRLRSSFTTSKKHFCCLLLSKFPMQKSTATAVSKLKSAILNITGKKGYTAAVARGIDETSNTVQLNGFFGKTVYFYNVSFSKCNFTCAFICFFIWQCACFILLFSTLNISQGFSLNFTRTLKNAQLTSCWMVQGLLHTGS